MFRGYFVKGFWRKFFIRDLIPFSPLGDAGRPEANYCLFQNVPPGRYLISGRPNPGSDNEQVGPVTVELKGGQTAELTLKAK